ncbi:MAG: transcription elongation factor GreA [Candidatus Wildermuthbacteria bacterium]|nr:transcription elongation factor GreA [Candidatus Wildermuthbacteria bacterium]
MKKYLTQDGFSKLTEELERLKTEKRKEVAERLRRAIAFGDLSENFEYSAAKDEQSMMEQRIAEIEDLLAVATIVESTHTGDTVQLGSSVTIATNDTELSFAVTDSESANPLEKKISVESPLGAALIGKKVGDRASVQTPNGEQIYVIRTVS